MRTMGQQKARVGEVRVKKESRATQPDDPKSGRGFKPPPLPVNVEGDGGTAAANTANHGTHTLGNSTENGNAAGVGSDSCYLVSREDAESRELREIFCAWSLFSVE